MDDAVSGGGVGQTAIRLGWVYRTEHNWRGLRQLCYVLLAVFVVDFLNVRIALGPPTEAGLAARIALGIKAGKAVSLFLLAWDIHEIASRVRDLVPAEGMEPVAFKKELDNTLLLHLIASMVAGGVAGFILVVVCLDLCAWVEMREQLSHLKAFTPVARFLFEAMAFLPVVVFLMANLRVENRVMRTSAQATESRNLTRSLTYLSSLPNCVTAAAVFFLGVYFDVFSNPPAMVFVSGAVAALVFSTLIVGTSTRELFDRDDQAALKYPSPKTLILVGLTIVVSCWPLVLT
jgi:hypothetical protein